MSSSVVIIKFKKFLEIYRVLAIYNFNCRCVGSYGFFLISHCILSAELHEKMSINFHAILTPIVTYRTTALRQQQSPGGATHPASAGFIYSHYEGN